MSQPQPSGRPPTEDEALVEATRLLHQAEMHTDRGLTRLYIDMADGWTTIAAVLAGRTELDL